MRRFRGFGEDYQEPPPIGKIDAQDTVSAVNKFNVEFVKKLISKSNDKNHFFSPVSIETAFAVLLEGAKGKTREQLIAGLQLDKVSDLTGSFEKLMKALTPQAGSKSAYELNFANIIAVNNKGHVLQEYKDKAKSSYLAEVREMDFEFNGKKCMDDLNGWVSEQTKGKIETVIAEPLTALNVMVIINAIYFQGSWVETFEEYSTKKEKFTNFDGTEKQVDMMHQTSKFRSLDLPQSTLVSLPYRGGTSMIIVLPHVQLNLVQILTGLDGNDLMKNIRTVSTSYPSQTRLWLPKFNLETNYDLKNEFKTLGMTDVFDEAQADLTGITEQRNIFNVFVNSAIHKAILEVNEEGTVAAAVTYMRMGARGRSAPPPPPKEIRVDRPFLLMIRHDQSGLIMFTGVVNKL